MQAASLIFPMFFMTLLLLLRVLTRRDWATVILFLCLSAVVGGNLAGANPYASVTLGVIGTGFRLIIIFRVGLLAAVVGSFTSLLLYTYPMTFDLQSWYSTNTVLVLLVIGGLAVYGFRIALAGRPIFRDQLLEG